MGTTGKISDQFWDLTPMEKSLQGRFLCYSNHHERATSGDSRLRGTPQGHGTRTLDGVSNSESQSIRH